MVLTYQPHGRDTWGAPKVYHHLKHSLGASSSYLVLVSLEVVQGNSHTIGTVGDSQCHHTVGYFACDAVVWYLCCLNKYSEIVESLLVLWSMGKKHNTVTGKCLNQIFWYATCVRRQIAWRCTQWLELNEANSHYLRYCSTNFNITKFCVPVGMVYLVCRCSPSSLYSPQLSCSVLPLSLHTSWTTWAHLR